MVDTVCNNETTKAPHLMTFQEITDLAENRKDVEAIFASEVKNYKERMKLPPKRQSIWDYFFYSNYDNVGKYEKKMIKNLPLALTRYIQFLKNEHENKIKQFSSKLEEETNKLRAKARRITNIYSIIGFFTVIPVAALELEPVARLFPVLEMVIKRSFQLSPLAFAACIAFFILICFLLTIVPSINRIRKLEEHNITRLEEMFKDIEKENDELEEQCKNTIADLRKAITHLKAFIPKKPRDFDIIDILKADSKKIKKYAMERMLLTVMEEPVDDFLPSDELPPFCEPALLQYKIPEFLDAIPQEHLEAMQTTDKAEDIYVVNYYTYIIPSQHQICVYSTYFDHILDNMYGEFTDSFCIRDIVSFSTKTQAQSISLRGEKVLIANAMLLAISLTSGEKVSFNVRNEDFRKSISRVAAEQESARLSSLHQELNSELAKDGENIDMSIINNLKQIINDIEKKRLNSAAGKVPQNADISLENIVKFLRKQVRDHKI